MTKKQQWVLAADIGGTNARFAYVPLQKGMKPQLENTIKYPTARFDGAQAVLAQYLKDTGFSQPERAVFGVAGPVVEGKCYMPNAGWSLNEKDLSEQLGAPVTLVNDMYANVSGLPVLDANDFVTLNKGVERNGHKVLISPGTGLGKAILAYDEPRKTYVVVAGEGGHTDLSPRDDEQDALLEFLRPRFSGRVSAERVCSGQGFSLIFDFLLQRGEIPQTLQDAVRASDDPARALQIAFDAGDATAIRLFKLYAKMLGNEAGDLALIATAVGGVYLGGGIPPRLLPWIASDPTFLNAFFDKAPHVQMLREMPVRLITNSDTALLGAAALACN